MITLRWCAFTIALTVGCASTSPAQRPDTIPATAASRELPPREKLPLAAREMLTLRMDRHGDRMVLLMESVVLLNYELAQVLAAELIAEPKLGRPAPDEKGTLNALLPAAFFTYQDQLGERARRLASAAESRSHEKMMAAYAGVAETCVGCHAAYLYEDDELEGDDESFMHGVPESSGAQE